MTTTALSSILNEELFQRALENYCNVNKTSKVTLCIKTCDFKLSSASGENFCSEIYQVDVKYELNGNDEKISFIIKIMIPEVAEMGTNEEIMLTKILPEMESCLNTNTNKLHARCLLSERKKEKKEEFYIMENLNALGYFCADRIKGLNLEHGEILMQKIAKYHAASMMFAKKFPDVIQSLGGSHFAEGVSDPIAHSITFGGLEYVANMIENWPSYESLALKVKSLIPQFNELVKNVANPKNAAFNVITHGDLWVNNFLYKYDKDTKNPIDVVFVDFQNSFWGSCGFDISYFLYTSLELDVLKENRQHLLQTYYDCFKRTLEEENFLQHEIPSNEDYMKEVKRCELISLYASLCEFPIVALDKSKCTDFDCNTFSQPDKMKEIRVLMYENPRVQETLKYTLKYFEEINIL